MPTSPDELPDPKAALLKLVRKSSKRELKRDILPPRGATSPVGLGYNSQLRHFVRSHWSNDRAAKHFPSLSRLYALAWARHQGNLPFSVV